MTVKQIETKSERLDMLSDEELLQLTYEGNSHALEFLINKYKGLIFAKAQTYFLIGGDREDIIQEGMIGLYKAIRDYERDKLASFKGFAELCITRHIITAIKAATRQKHQPLNSYISLDKPIYDEDSERTLLDIIEGSRTVDPQELLINREKFNYVQLRLSQLLTDLEKTVLQLYLEGRSYKEMSVKINRHVKSIDNALQRVKRKFERLVESNEFRF